MYICKYIYIYLYLYILYQLLENWFIKDILSYKNKIIIRKKEVFRLKKYKYNIILSYKEIKDLQLNIKLHNVINT